MAELRSGAATNPGMVRAENEDTFVDGPFVFAVADGMGGHQAGEVASALAASIVRDKLGQGAASEDQAISVVLEANAAIHGAARANAAQTGMGTTLTAIAVLKAQDHSPEQLVLLNVGDSRTYRFRSGRLQRVTVDHSYVQELVATGHITIEEARTHPRRNIVTRALGIEPSVRTDMWTLPLVRGDRFVLCSDGLVDEVPDNEILELVAAVEDPQALSEQLVDLANRHGGRDNVTVVVVDVLDGAEPPDPTGEMTYDPEWVGDADEPAIWADDATAPPDAASTDGVLTPDEASHAAEITRPDLTAIPTEPPPAVPVPTLPTLPIPPTLPTPPIRSTTPTPTTTAGASDGPDAAEAPTIVSAGAAGVGAPAGSAPSLPSATSQPVMAPEVKSAAPADVASTAHPRKRRLTGGLFLFIVVLAAIITVTFTLIAVHARSGYFVGFDGDRVVVFKGQPGGVLWFDPTVAQVSARTRDELDPTLIAVIDQHVTYESAEQAAAFINEQVVPTTTTEVTTTTVAASTTTTQSTGETTTTVPTGG